MADILSSAQKSGFDTPGGNPAGAQPPVQSDTALPESPADIALPDLPFSAHGTQADIQSTTSEALQAETPSAPEAPSPPHQKKINVGKALSIILLLFVTLPLSVYLVSTKNEIADTRSEAAYVTSENNLYVANLDTESFSVIWKEQLPSKGCAVAINTKTKQETKVCDPMLSRMHLLHIPNLAPFTSHKVYALGNKKMSLHAFFGGSVLTGLFDKSRPAPAITEGKILKADGSPLTNVFVIITPFLTDRFYFPVAASVDGQGMYTVDLSLIDAQIPPPYEMLVVEVVDRSGNTLIEQKITRPADARLPPVTVNE